MKKLLFVIPGLDAGGAEKSLVNLLNTIDETRFSVDLFLFSHRGLFFNQIPEFVNILPKNKDFETFQKPLISSVLQFLGKGKFYSAIRRVMFFLANKMTKNTSVAEQYSWKHIKKSIKTLNTEYDAAIGFLEKSSIYFVVDKVLAKKKIGFIHTYYSKLNIDREFEKNYFSALGRIVTVSMECLEDLKNIFPEFSENITVLHNIVSSDLIKKLSGEEIKPLSQNAIVSIGRLIPLKGFDMAVKAAVILKKKNTDFHWYIIGEGSERQNLEQMIKEHRLQDNFTLLGLKENPYPYIKQAKIFVQPSRYEGKSIAIDEAKILVKPVVLTNFTTAKDQIENGVNGLICEMNPEALAESILKYFDEPGFTDKIIANLQSGSFGTEKEIEKFYEIINE
ncbi:MAG: glycosyltransferase [Flavobacteriaceae bacterium]|nr:glycosyltransferase [Flavobacteriaceae bacterium]